MELFKITPVKPYDECYNEWVDHCQKFTKPYAYAGWSIDDLKAVAPTVNEFTQAFYMKAIITKKFDIDAEWPKIVEDYYKNNGQKALDIFTNYIYNNS